MPLPEFNAAGDLPPGVYQLFDHALAQARHGASIFLDTTGIVAW